MALARGGLISGMKDLTFYQFSVYLGKQFQRKRLLDINQPKNKNGL
jgi:hypothetical protein